MEDEKLWAWHEELDAEDLEAEFEELQLMEVRPFEDDDEDAW